MEIGRIGAAMLHRAFVAGGLAQAVLSAWWSYEDGDADWQPAIAFAGHLAAMKV